MPCGESDDQERLFQTRDVAGNLSDNVPQFIRPRDPLHDLLNGETQSAGLENTALDALFRFSCAMTHC